MGSRANVGLLTHTPVSWKSIQTSPKNHLKTVASVLVMLHPLYTAELDRKARTVPRDEKEGNQSIPFLAFRFVLFVCFCLVVVFFP